MVDVRVLLDDGAWTLTENARANEHARRLRAQARDLLLTYRHHRMRLLSGGDGSLPDGSTSNDDGLRARVRLLRKPHETTALRVGPCTKTRPCDLCGKTIVPGKNQFAIQNAERTFHLDDECFKVWQEEASRT